MTQAFFIGVVVGVVVGIAIFYLLKQDQLEKTDKLENELKQVKEELARAEASHEQRLRDATEALKWDYQKLNDQRIAQLTQEHRAEIAKLQGQSQATIAKSEATNELQNDLWADSPTIEPEAINEPVMIPSEPEISPEVIEPTAIELEVREQPVIITSESETITETEQEVIEATNSQVTATIAVIKQNQPDLLTTVETLAASGSVANIHQLMTYFYEKDDHIRALVASGLGKIAANSGLRQEVQQAIPVLEKLSKDSASSVRKKAVIALGNIKSNQAIKLLETALRDYDPEVVSCANLALTNLKGYRIKLDTEGKSKAKNKKSTK